MSGLLGKYQTKDNGAILMAERGINMLLLGFIIGTVFGFVIAAILDISRKGGYDSEDD